MKFVISLLVCQVALASPIRIFHESKAQEAKIVGDIFTGKYGIPEDLIAIKNIGDCGKISGKGRLDLCLKNNGDLLVVSADQSFIHESLKVFQAP